MAQIIKHRRGSIGSVKTVTARNAELLVASGSISDLNGPFVLIGSPNASDEGVAGAYKAVSKIYMGTNVPTIAAGTYGSTVDGTPFYSTNDQTLYILGNDGAGGNTNMDLTGNLEGRSIDKITLQSINGSIQVTGSIEARGSISASGDITASNLSLSGNANISGNINLGGNINIGNQTTDLIVFGGEVSSSILPEIDNSFDFGAPTQNWRNIHVSGTAYINTAKIVSINMQGAQVFDDLIVSGNTFLGDKTTDGVYLTGSLNISGSQSITGSVDVLGVVNFNGGNVSINDDLYISGGLVNVANVATDIEIKDNTTAALTISQGSDNYVKIDTNDGSEKITIGNNITSIDNVVEDNVTNAFVVKENTNEYIKDNTTDGSEKVTIGNNITSIDNIVEDNVSNAFVVKEGSTNYFKVDTTDAAEKITIGNTITSVETVVEDNKAAAYQILEGTNPYLTIDTTNGSEKFKFETGSVEVTGITTISNTTQNTTWNDGALIVAGGVGIGKNLFVSGSTVIQGNLTILGSSSIVNISASTIELDDNIIRLNAYSPYQRYAGFEVMDSGSNNVSASLLWDSTNDYFLIVSASGESGRMISTTFGTQGSEVALTPNTLPKATGASAIGDSYLTDDGVKLSYYTDALIVTGSSGQTYIKGKVTLAHNGGTDAASVSSAMIFRNSSNELGYVSTTVTTNVLGGILGYRESDGLLEFSTKIDGGYF